MTQNPYESPTLEVSTAPVVRSGRVPAFLLAACALLPLFHYLYVLIFWLFASVANGEWMRPGACDPKTFMNGVPLYAHYMLLLGSFAVAPAVLFLGYLNGKMIRMLMAYGTCLAVSIVLFRLDIQQITSWISD